MFVPVPVASVDCIYGAFVVTAVIFLVTYLFSFSEERRITELNVCAALSFIRTVEFPDLLRLRVEMLTENGCNQLALNLVRWCLRCDVFHNDVMLRSYLLLLLHRLGDMCEFDNQVFSPALPTGHYCAVSCNTLNVKHR